MKLPVRLPPIAALSCALCLLAVSTWLGGQTTGPAPAKSPTATTAASGVGCWGTLSRTDRGAGTLYIDNDGDGFGVASPSGPDCDDGDAKLNSPATIKEKAGNIGKFLRQRAGAGSSILYISPSGDDSTAKPDDPAKPYASFEKAKRLLGAGDIAVFREGTYDGPHCDNMSGKEGKPIVIMSAPGEKVTFTGGDGAITIKHSSHLVLDGFAITPKEGARGDGMSIYWCHNVTLRNLEVSGFTLGIRGMQDLHDLVIENCVVHDNGPSHGIYLGCRDLVNSDITVRNCLLYRNGEHGVQHNGRVTNFCIEGNVIHSNGLGGVSLIQGACKSAVRNNLIFNNCAQGIVFYLYDAPASSGITTNDQTGNIVENNTIWVGQSAPGGKKTPADHAAIQFSDATSAQKCDMNATIRNNILVTFAGPAMRFDQRRFMNGCTIGGNTLWWMKGPLMNLPAASGKAATVVDEVLTLEELQAKSEKIRNNATLDPQFKKASTDDFDHPELFDFKRK